MKLDSYAPWILTPSATWWTRKKKPFFEQNCAQRISGAYNGNG
jgi:hypothetical protein